MSNIDNCANIIQFIILTVVSHIYTTPPGTLIYKGVHHMYCALFMTLRKSLKISRGKAQLQNVTLINY